MKRSERELECEFREEHYARVGKKVSWVVVEQIESSTVVPGGE